MTYIQSNQQCSSIFSQTWPLHNRLGLGFGVRSQRRLHQRCLFLEKINLSLSVKCVRKFDLPGSEGSSELLEPESKSSWAANLT